MKSPQEDQNPRKKAKESDKVPEDLSSLLSAWEYDEARSVRRFRASDGREVIQVRLPLGIEQYEMHGRPDGKRPLKAESWLHYYSKKAMSRSEDSQEHFLSEDDFMHLFQEGLLYYYRYLLFFQIQEYRLCARDTRRNLRLLDFVAEHARPDLAEQLEQYRPYILRMHVMSKALLKIQSQGNVRLSLKLLRDGRSKIEALEPLPGNQVFEWEKTRALHSLDDLVSQLEAQLPLSKEEKLRKQMAEAVEVENYEKAASLRDELARLRKRKSRSCEKG